MSTRADCKLRRRTACSFDQSVYDFDDVRCACGLNNAIRRQLRTDGPVRGGAVGVLRRIGVQDVGKTSILQGLTLKLVSRRYQTFEMQVRLTQVLSWANAAGSPSRTAITAPNMFQTWYAKREANVAVVETLRARHGPNLSIAKIAD
jgi:hypothetical protein